MDFIQLCECVIANSRSKLVVTARRRHRITSSATASSSSRDCDATSSLLRAADGAGPTATPCSHARLRALLPGRARASSPARHATAATSIGFELGGCMVVVAASLHGKRRRAVPGRRQLRSASAPPQAGCGRPLRFGHLWSGFYTCGTPIARCVCQAVWLCGRGDCGS